jgi:hypothetical protein
MNYLNDPIRTRAPQGCSIGLLSFIVFFILAALLSWKWK